LGCQGWGMAKMKMKDQEQIIWERASSYASMSGVIVETDFWGFLLSGVN
jgi:hypothetical protein